MYENFTIRTLYNSGHRCKEKELSPDALLLNKSDIQSRGVTPKSMMPEGLFTTLAEAEKLDLAAYLWTTKQTANMVQ